MSHGPLSVFRELQKNRSGQCRCIESPSSIMTSSAIIAWIGLVVMLINFGVSIPGPAGREILSDISSNYLWISLPVLVR